MSIMTEPLHVSSMWESAYVYAFCFHFGNLVSGSDQFNPEDFERDLYSSTPTALLDCLFYTFLTNALNRKKQIDRASFRRSFSDLIDAKVKLGDFELDENPLKHAQSYHEFKPDVKLLLLKALVDWQLQDSTIVRQAIERYYGNGKNRSDNPLHVIPFGTDGKKRIYWHFGDNARLYREKAPSYSQNPRTSTWEAVTTNLEELKGFAANELLSPVDTVNLSPTLSPTRSSTPPVSGKSKSKITNFFPTKPTTPKPAAIPKCEKMLHTRITEELIPHIEQRILRRERLEKSRQRILSSLANTRITETRTRLRTNRQPVKYNFDDEPDDEFDQYYEENDDRASSAGSKQGSRSTSRSSSKNPSNLVIPRIDPVRRSTRGQRGSQSREGSMDTNSNLDDDIKMNDTKMNDAKMNDTTMENREQEHGSTRQGYDIVIELESGAPFTSNSSSSTLFTPNGESKRLAGSKRGSYSSLEPDDSESQTEPRFEESEMSEFSEGGELGSAPKKIKSDHVVDGIGLTDQIDIAENDFEKTEKEVSARLGDKTMLEG